MKGMSLPINVIVVVAIAVLVMIVVSAFFTTSVVSGTGTINAESAYNAGCARLVQVEKCTKEPFEILISGYNPRGDPDLKDSGDSLLQACRLKFNDRTMTDTPCKKACGCDTSGGLGEPDSQSSPGTR